MGLFSGNRIIIGIHGLGNKPPRRLLKSWWKKSLREGLRAGGYFRLFFDFELVYWADILHDRPLDPDETDRKSAHYLAEPYRPGLNFVQRKPSELRRRFLSFLERRLDRLFLKTDLTLKFPAISNFVVQRFFKDLEIYYRNGSENGTENAQHPRELIRSRLAETLRSHRGKRILLIGHSMGSIVAYDVLTRCVPDIDIHTLVTIGSPLGQPLVMSKIHLEQKSGQSGKTRVSTPPNVRHHWFNLSDLEDRVAMNYNLADDYQANASGVRAVDKIVENNYEIDGRKNPHKSYGYLRTIEMADIIHHFLQGKGSGNFLKKLKKLTAGMLDFSEQS